jgi:hypothetical protein
LGRWQSCRCSTTRGPGKAIRPVTEHSEDYACEYEAIKTVAGRVGMNPETLRKWLRQAETDAGVRDGTTTASARDGRSWPRRPGTGRAGHRGAQSPCSRTGADLAAAGLAWVALAVLSSRSPRSRRLISKTADGAHFSGQRSEPVVAKD